MNRTRYAIGLSVAIFLLVACELQAQRGGRGGGGRGGGGGGGGMRAGGGGGARPGGMGVGQAAPRPAAPRGGSVAGAYGGGAPAARSSSSVVGPAGGTRTHGSGSGSYTTKGGSTIDYAGAGRGGTTPGGVHYGRGVGGVQVTTPGGKEVSKVGKAGGAVGPGGNAVGGRSGVVTGSGPGGSFSSAYKGGVAIGPQGAAAAGGRVGAATGPGGNTVAGATRGAAAAGPYGAAAARAGAVTGAGGTYYRSAAAVANHGYAVRQNFREFAHENPWLTARWLGPTWRPITWSALSSYGAYAAEPVYYNYGDNVVYSGETVTFNGVTEIPAEQFVQEAVDLAVAGQEAKVEDPKSEDFKPLGVFAMVGEGETKATNIFQLAVNKAGIIRGEYYNALTDATEAVAGSVDNKTQRAAWNVGGKKTPTYEAGLANLTKEETTMLVHFSKGNSQQFTLVRIQPPEDGKPAGGK